MNDTFVTVQRGQGVTLVGTDGRAATHIRVQWDQASDKEVMEYRQITMFQGSFLYKIYTYGWNANALIKQGDFLLDEIYVDPDSPNGANYRFRVIGRPKNFWYDHQQLYCDAVVGG